MKPAITEVTEGLLPVHATARPLLDRVEVQGRGREQVRRTYPDGAQYLLTSEESGVAATWTPFVAITQAGVAKIRQLITQEFVAKAPSPPPPGPSTGGGSIIWVAYLEDGVRVVQTASGNYAALPGFVKELDEAVSLNVKRAE